MALAPWQEFARAPLVPIALAAAVGLTLDRYAEPRLELELGVALVGLGGFVARRGQPFAPAWLWLMTFALAAAGYQVRVRQLAPNDLAHLARAEPTFVRVRGMLRDDPVTRLAPINDPLEPRNRADRDQAPLEVHQLESPTGWVAATGLVRLHVDRDAIEVGMPIERSPLRGLRAGDQVEVAGQLSAPGPPRNPGEADLRRVYADRGWRGDLRLHSAALVVRLDRGPLSLTQLLAGIRRAASDALTAALPRPQVGPAVALLLGDGSAMEQAEWAGYIRTGVVHALAISGSHLAVLAGFLWTVARLGNVRRAHAAWLVIGVVGGYALLTGLRPSGVRAAVMVTTICLGVALRMSVNRANSFAFAWLITALINPADPFSLGSQFSFLSVFVLIWGIGPWFRPRELSPEQQLIADSRSAVEQLSFALVRLVGRAYAVTLVLAVVNAPLQLATQNLASPVGILIGPAVVLLTETALIAGFLLILTSPIPGASLLLAIPVNWCLVACRSLVLTADALPGGVVYLPGVSLIWLAGFYLMLVGLILAPGPWNRRVAMLMFAWTVIALLLPRGSSRPDGEMRVTVLAVGKGGCIVVETPDGRTLIYDAGTTSGPRTMARVVAPYLWSRGITRVDELILSHADFDHFNGILELRRRFPIGRVTLTPSFAEKPTREVIGALAVLRDYQLPSELAYAGQTRTAGDVTLAVLHPPRTGPPGSENERSLVIRLTHRNQSILLTGDLEKQGTAFLLAQEPQACAVLLAPHHGSRAALPPALVNWCQPRLILVSRGPPLGNSITSADVPPDVVLWDTQTAGAVTLRSHATGLTAEAFLSGERRVIARATDR